jgi:hypothetical protein
VHNESEVGRETVLDVWGLWLEASSSTRCTSRWAGTFWSIVLRNFKNSMARWRGCNWPIASPDCTLSAAHRLEGVPCRS